MVYAEQNATSGLRSEVIDKVIKGFAPNMYKFLQAVSVSPTSGNKLTYWQKESTVLSAPDATAPFKGIPRGGNFPQVAKTFQKASSYIVKHGAEDVIYWEDILSDDIDIQAETLSAITETVVCSVDTNIWDTLSESRSPSKIQSITIAAGYSWDTASSAVIDDLLYGVQKIATKNYPTENLMLFVNPRDYRSIVNYVVGKGAQFQMLANDAATNGKVMKLAGVGTIITSNNVTTSYAMLLVPKQCASWKELVPLKTETIIDPFKSVKIRAVQEGITQLTDPDAVVLYINTQSA